MMGREVRRVPPNWQHPKSEQYGDDRLQPMYDETFADAAAKWKANFAKWEAGERDSWCDKEDKKLEYWEWDGRPPDRLYYRPYTDEEATWFQLWETVSEGTPVSPPFETQEELAQHLAVHGDDWDRKRGHGGWGIDRARAFVEAGWAPTMMVVTSDAGTSILDSKDIPLEARKP